MSLRKLILSIDFDGVIHSYTSGWQGATVIPDPPVFGAVSFIGNAVKFFDVQIFSSRSNHQGGIEAMKAWFNLYFPEETVAQLSFPTVKPPAVVGLDDRVITFGGPDKWPSMQQLRDFKPWNKRDGGEPPQELYRPELKKELLAVTKKPVVQSLLYDLDLLPEQLDSQEELTVGLFGAYNRLEGILLAFKAMELMEEKEKGKQHR